MKKLFGLLVFTVLLAFQSPILADAEIEHAVYASLNQESQEEKQGSEVFVQSYELQKFYRDDLEIQLPQDVEKTVREVLAELPESHTYSLKRIYADYGENARRGLASFRSMYLGLDLIDSPEELRRVVIHEVGHVLDLGALKASSQKKSSAFLDGSSTIYETDPSLDFYRLCWDDSYTQNGQCGDLDFVSGYAQTDVFEDFAESYLLFVENNLSFQKMAEESSVIKQKYDFFAERVFSGEFQETLGADLPEGERVWDLTVL